MRKWTFSRWYPWEQLRDVPEANSNGVFIIARFSTRPRNPASHIKKEVVFVGGSYGQTSSIRKRLGDFNASATTGRKRASGGQTYFREFKGDTRGLYFAFTKITFRKDIFDVVRDCVYEMLRDYHAKWSDTPVCNTRKLRDDR